MKGINMGKRYHNLWFRAPSARVGPETLMEKLTAFKAVKEVMVMDAKDGYAAKVRFFAGEEPEDVEGYFSCRIDKRFGRLAIR
jgi:hypothetical protein